MVKTSGKYYIYLIIFLGLLSAFGPFVIDMYLPALPEMTRVFQCDAATVQLGLTFCMIGLAVGQLLFGPASDKYGRKSVLVFSLIIFVAASVICCFSTSVVAFTAARLFQGVGGAGGIVLSRSIAADMYSGRELAKQIAILSAINNLAPVAAPVAGGAVAHVWGWEGIFIILLVLGVLLLGVSIPLQESLESGRRFAGRLMASVKGYREVLKVQGFASFSIVYALAMAALFAYISATPLHSAGWVRILGIAVFAGIRRQCSGARHRLCFVIAFQGHGQGRAVRVGNRRRIGSSRCRDGDTRNVKLHHL